MGIYLTNRRSCIEAPIDVSVYICVMKHPYCNIYTVCINTPIFRHGTCIKCFYFCEVDPVCFLVWIFISMKDEMVLNGAFFEHKATYCKKMPSVWFRWKGLPEYQNSWPYFEKYEIIGWAKGSRILSRWALKILKAVVLIDRRYMPILSSKLLLNKTYHFNLDRENRISTWDLHHMWHQ